jgi:hypothetical protein
VEKALQSAWHVKPATLIGWLHERDALSAPAWEPGEWNFMKRQHPRDLGAMTFAVKMSIMD